MIKFNKHTHFAKGLLTGLLLLWVCGLMSQQVVFKEPIRLSIRTQSIVENYGYYYSVGQFYNGTLNNFGINLLKIDMVTGQVVKEKRIIDSNVIWYPSNHVSIESTFDGNMITIANKVSNPRISGFLKFDADLDTLNYFTPVVDGEIRTYHNVKQLPDSGFVLTGHFYDQVDNMYHANLIRTDKNGQLLWEKVFQEPDTFSLEPIHVILAPDGGFLLSGNKVYLPDEQTQDPLLIRTDSAGNLLWKKTYGGNQVDGIACAAYRDDGNIMLYYTQGTMPIQQGHRLMPVFSVINDQDGQELLRKTFPFINYRKTLSYNLLKDEDKFIAIGQFSPEGTLTGGSRQGYTIAVDDNLSDIWFRNYSLHGVTAPIDDWSVLYDLRSTSDGGYISGGYVLSIDTTQLDLNWGFNGWIVKMDSMGCVEQSCVNHIGKEELIAVSNLDLQVFPNPASGPIHIEMSRPAKGKAILYNLNGMILQENELIGGTGTLNTGSELAAGIYFVKVTDDIGYSATVKIILQ